MVRRPIAVFLACLHALGGACAAPASAASPATTRGPAGSVPRGSAASRPDHCLTRPAGPARRRALTHALEPREPSPDEVARMSADLARRLKTARPGQTPQPEGTARPGQTPRPGDAARPGQAPQPGGAVRDAANGARSAPATLERITVPVWAHIIRDHALGLPDAAVARQIAVLNTAYSGGYGGADTGVRFQLKGITHTDNRNWFRDPLGYEEPMKKKLRVGGPETLNLYIAQLSRLVLGYSTYPYWYEDEPVLDGVVIDWRSVPGGPLRDFARGFTAVHEIGHWFGLLHTFENGCKAPGDSVDDTPAEAYPTTGCPKKKDTCPAPGGDPVHNFMDYAQDRCMREFTVGQGVRIHEMWDAYRRPVPRNAATGLQDAAEGLEKAAAGPQVTQPIQGAQAAQVAQGAVPAPRETAEGADVPVPSLATQGHDHPLGGPQGDAPRGDQSPGDQPSSAGSLGIAGRPAGAASRE